MTKYILAFLFIICPIFLCADNSTERPSTWAEPITLEGVPNLHKVASGLYRSAQPDNAGMVNLKKIGIKTIVNLRSFHSDKDEMGQSGFDYEHIYMKAWHPEIKEAVRFLSVVTDPKRSPVLVHCLHGADRTGTMCALYRVAVQGWTKEEAVREMTQGGYGYHEVFENLPEWISDLDIEAIKKDVFSGAPKKMNIWQILKTNIMNHLIYILPILVLLVIASVMVILRRSSSPFK